MAFNYKKALALALSAAMVVTAAPVAGLDVQAAAKKQGTAATKITPTKTSYSVKVGKKTTAITLKLNKKTTKKVTINLKSSNKKVATVSKSKVTIKKGKAGTKSASFTIKGVKKGSAKITASFVNSKGKTVSKKITVKVTKAAATKVAVTGVTLSNTTPKVGDTITANVTPSNATNVASYQWFTGATASLTDQISGATEKNFAVTADQLGKFVGVVVTDTDGKSFTAVSSVAVQEADSSQISLVSAKQTGAKSLEVTASSKITASDKITVKKGSTEIKIDGAITYTDNVATFSLVDRITASEYEITLTPGDTKVAASSVKFTGEISELKEIKFLNDVLVMKNNDYAEGYAYAKGYDQFGGEVNLSGLSVTAGVGTYEKYDSNTGKITIKDKNHTSNGGTSSTGAFMLVKEVPVFIQYQQGNQMLSANKTLTVSTQAYVSDVEFEEEIGKDGTMRDDKKLTLSELGSGKYYVGFKSIKDQYGNEMDVDTLNEQKDGANKTLFVIPGDSGAFYQTGKFGTLNGKTILWLKSVVNGKPGTMALTITGAGGKTFTKDVTIVDDPFIQTLTVSYPELYSGQKESMKMEFSAKDQYGNDVDLWDFKPATKFARTTIPADKDTLEFSDENGMTQQVTSIKVSGGVYFNEVLTDSAKKTFTVTVNCSNKNFGNPLVTAAVVDSKTMAVFTATTAGMDVKTTSITVGEKGTAAKVKSTLASGANTQLEKTSGMTGKDTTFNFNKYVQFEDANGNTMVRETSEMYPKFLTAVPAANNVKDPVNTITVDKYTGFAWTLTNKKVVASNANTAVADADGVIGYDDLAGASADYYVTVYGVKDGVYYILDDQDFHLTKVVGTKDKKYDISWSGLLYAVVGSTDSEEIKVKATTDTGEQYTVAESRISVVVSGDFKGDGNKVYSNLSQEYDTNTDGTVTATVYVDNKDIGSVDVKYSNRRPVASATKYEFETLDGTPATSLVGAKFDGDLTSTEFTTAATPTFTINNGVLTIVGINSLGDKMTACVKDQYDQEMTDTKFYQNGTEIKNGTHTGTARNTYQFSNGSQGKKFYMTFAADTVIGVTSISVDNSVTTERQLSDAIAAANGETIEVADDITLTSALTINNNNTVVVKAGKTLNENGNNLTVQAGSTLDVEGAVTVTGTFTDNGNIIVGSNGVLNSTALAVAANHTLENNGNVTIAGLTNGGSVTNNGTMELITNASTNNKTFVNKGTLTVTKALTNAANASLTNAKDATIAANDDIDNVYTLNNKGTITVATLKKIDNSAATSILTNEGTISGAGSLLNDGQVIEAADATLSIATANLNDSGAVGTWTVNTAADLKKIAEKAFTNGGEAVLGSDITVNGESGTPLGITINAKSKITVPVGKTLTIGQYGSLTLANVAGSCTVNGTITSVAGGALVAANAGDLVVNGTANVGGSTQLAHIALGNGSKLFYTNTDTTGATIAITGTATIGYSESNCAAVTAAGASAPANITYGAETAVSAATMNFKNSGTIVYSANALGTGLAGWTVTGA